MSELLIEKCDKNSEIGYIFYNGYNEIVDRKLFGIKIKDVLDVSKLLKNSKFRQYQSRKYLIDNFNFVDVTDETLDDYIEYISNNEKDNFGDLVNVDYINEINKNEFSNVFMNIDSKDAVKIIELNPILKNANIYLGDKFDIKDSKLLDYLIKKFDGITDKVYISLDGNYSYITLSEAKMTVDKISEIAKEIKSLKLSPIEKIMYAYDIVKEREYKKEEDGDSHKESRQLTNVLFGDKIVCVGFSVYFNAILKRLGFNPYEISLPNTTKDGGHQRSGLYVKDSKYKIDGFYYFDLTMDSRKKEDKDDDAINRYLGFALTKSQIDMYDNGEFVEENIPLYSKNFLEFFEDASKGFDPKLYRDFILSAATIVRYTGNYDKCDKPQTGRLNFELLVDSVEKMEKPLSEFNLVEVLKSVRSKQNMVNPDKYPNYDSKNSENLCRYFRRPKTTSQKDAILLAIYGTNKIIEEQKNTINRIRKKFVEDK